MFPLHMNKCIKCCKNNTFGALNVTVYKLKHLCSDARGPKVNECAAIVKQNKCHIAYQKSWKQCFIKSHLIWIGITWLSWLPYYFMTGCLVSVYTFNSSIWEHVNSYGSPAGGCFCLWCVVVVKCYTKKDWLIDVIQLKMVRWRFQYWNTSSVGVLCVRQRQSVIMHCVWWILFKHILHACITLQSFLKSRNL